MARPGVLLGLLLVAILYPAHSLDKYIEDTDRFPGWRGELPEHVDVPTSDTVGFGELGQVCCAAEWSSPRVLAGAGGFELSWTYGHFAPAPVL